MKVAFPVVTVAITLAMALPALAQQAAPAAPASPAPAAAAPAAGAPSDEDVTKFGTVMARFQDLQKQGKGGDRTAMAAVLTDVGLSIETYNKLTTSMASDMALNDRIQAAYRSAVVASQPPAAGTPSQN